mgnify:CR=1 FL=1
MGDAFDDWSGIGKHLDDTPKTTKGLTKGADTATDAVEDFTRATPAPKPGPKTALNPAELEPKLTGEFDGLVASAKSPEPRRGIGFKPQDNVAPASTTNGAPEGMRRQIGFGNQGNYIPDEAGKAAANGGGGVQDFTKGNSSLPGSRTPEGPSARNPYDVRNQAGGTPDTPGTPQQDLSGLNQNISTSNPPRTTKEFDELYQGRNKNLADKMKILHREQDPDTYQQTFKNVGRWRNLDNKLKGAYNVTIDGKYVVVNRKLGEPTVVTVDEFKAWLAGVDGIPEASITPRERDAIKGLDKVLNGGTTPKAPTVTSPPVMQPSKPDVSISKIEDSVSPKVETIKLKLNLWKQ